MFYNKSAKEFCRALPKIELHAHMNGSLDKEILQKLGCNSHGIFEYQKLANIIEKKDKSLDECFKLFSFAHSVTNTLESLYLAATSVIEDFYNDNVIYLELRTTPRTSEFLSLEDYIESVVKAVQDNKKDILVKLLLSIDRRHNLNTAENHLNVIIDMKNKYPSIIKGVDLSGNPNCGIFNVDLFKKARDNGLFTSIHCGEVKNNEEINSILEFGPDRIGHASFLHPAFGGTEKNWQNLCQAQIPLECCLTSNVLCGIAENYKTHHIKEWIKTELPFCLCTDDKGVFSTSLSKEFQLAYEHLNMTYEDLWNVSLKSVRYIFGSEDDKKYLENKLKTWKKENTILETLEENKV